MLLIVFMITEVIVAFLAGSLTLLSNASHRLTDVGAMGASFCSVIPAGCGWRPHPKSIDVTEVRIRLWLRYQA